MRLRLVALLSSCLLLSTYLSLATTPGAWVYTGSMNTARYRQTSTLLNNGMVLITGGGNSCDWGCVVLASAEAYSPASGTFSTTGSLSTPRWDDTATLLNNGMVLIAGGDNVTNGDFTYLASAELYNASTGTFTITGNMSTARYAHTATLLNNGMVLIAGGEGSSGALTSAELYNPTTGTFTPTGSLNTARWGHTATLLNNGMVLIAGGTSSGYLASAELYNPASGTFTKTGSMNTARLDHTAALLNNGKVLIAGGYNSNANGFVYLAGAELYNPTTGTFTITGNMSTARYAHTATLLNNGMALVAGGYSGTNVLASADLYSPATGTFTATATLNTGRYGHTATLLDNGVVLVAGGGGSVGTLASAELYQPTSLTPAGLLSISVAPTNPWLPIGSAMGFIATGNFSGNGPETLQSVTWSSSNAAVATITNDSGGSSTNTSTNRGNAYGLASGTTTITACAGSICGSTALASGPHRTTILGGSYTGGSSSYEIRDDSLNLLASGILSDPLANHTATLLQNGDIFTAGGSYNSTLWQIFSVGSGSTLQRVSSGFTQNSIDFSFSVLLANGNVMIGGGAISPSTWEIHSPTGALVTSGSLNGARTSGASAILLKNGNVWISGAYLGTGDACTWEIHNENGALVSSGSLNTCFAGGKVQLLNNGNVILLGGDNATGALEIYTPAGFRVRTGSMINGFNHGSTSVALNGGTQILIFGSCASGFENPGDPNFHPTCSTVGAQGTWELLGFDTNSNTTSDTTGSLFDSRSSARAVVTSTGNVLMTGGQFAPQTWEMWAVTGTKIVFVSQGGLFDTRAAGHTDTHQ